MKTTLHVLTQVPHPTNYGQYVIHEFVKEIDLPFPPYVGLAIELGPDPYGEIDYYDVTKAVWHHPTQQFYLYTEDDVEQANHPLNPEPTTPTKIVNQYTKLGWTLMENEHGTTHIIGE